MHRNWDFLRGKMEKERERFLELLRSKSFQRKKIVLASGKESDFYIDCREVTLNPEGIYLTGKVFFKILKSHTATIDAVGAVPVAAVPIAAAISVISYIEGSPIPAFVIRKEPKAHGTGKWIEGAANLKKGAVVAIVEDVITTGGSVLKAIKTAENEGLKVDCVIAIVDREEGGREGIVSAGYNLITLYTRKDFM